MGDDPRLGPELSLANCMIRNLLEMLMGAEDACGVTGGLAGGD